MHKITVNIMACVLPFLVTGFALNASAGQFFKWVDQNGNVHYGDNVPPEYLDQEHRVINEQGVTVDVTGAAKTPEELAEEQRQAHIREEQRRITEEQAARDRALLQMFGNVDDMLLTRDGKIAAIDAVIRITQSNINGLRQSLDQLFSRAARLERGGSQVSGELRQEIENIQRQIRDNLAFIDTQRKEQEAIRRKFAADIKRFQELQAAMSANNEQMSEQHDNDEEKATTATVICEDRLACNRAWSLAQLFVRERATVRIQLVTDTLIMTFEPKEKEDVGMSIARYPEAGESARLEMDLVCHDSREGRRLCRSSKVQGLKAEFKSYIDSRLH